MRFRSRYGVRHHGGSAGTERGTNRGDRVRFRAGALSGTIEGVVVDISLTYVRLATEDGPALVPNSQALAGSVLLVPDEPDETGGATTN